MSHERILILDFGAQYTQLIARRIRQAGVYCEIHPCDVGDDFIRSFGARGIILSGSHLSAHEECTERAPAAIFSLPKLCRLGAACNPNVVEMLFVEERHVVKQTPLGERIRAHGCGWTIDPMDPDGIRVLVDRLDRGRDELVRVTREVLRVPLETVEETAHRYAALYKS